MAVATTEAPAVPDLATAVRSRCEVVISAELARLARRTSLDGADLAVVAGALYRLADNLLLDRLRAAPPERVADLLALNDLGDRTHDHTARHAENTR